MHTTIAKTFFLKCDGKKSYLYRLKSRLSIQASSFTTTFPTKLTGIDELV